jgi:hypothetical protein
MICLGDIQVKWTTPRYTELRLRFNVSQCDRFIIVNAMPLVMRRIALGLLSIVIAACGSTPSNQSSMLEATLPPNTEVLASTATPASVVQVELVDVQVSLRVPPDWETLHTRNGILLAEALGNGHELAGPQMHVVVHDTRDFTLPTPESTESVMPMLQHIVAQKRWVGNAAVTEPVPLQWPGRDAAYYLVRDRTSGNHTIVLGIVPEQPDRLLAFNLSTPPDKAEMLLYLLPSLLQEVQINGEPIDPTVFSALPEDLAFPDV